MNFKDDAHRRELLSMLERLGMVITNPLPKTQQQQPLPSSTTLPLSNQSMTSGNHCACVLEHNTHPLPHRSITLLESHCLLKSPHITC